MANDISIDIPLGLTKNEWGDATRPQTAVLTITTRKPYDGGLRSSYSVYWLGKHSRSTAIGLAGDGDFGGSLLYNRTARATQKAIDTQHAQVFTPETIATLTQRAKDHYASSDAITRTEPAQ